jgi:hypothetical protein
MLSPKTRLDELATGFLHGLANGSISSHVTEAFRFTENGADVSDGGSRLARAESFTGVQAYADQNRSQVVVMGLASLAPGANHAFALRLALDGGRGTEAEIVVASDRYGHFSDVEQLAHPDILYQAPVPRDRASDEAELLRIANGYWDALEAGEGRTVPVDYRCDSFHNGKRITNNLSILLSPDATVHTVESLVNGTRGARPAVHDRRFPVVDPHLGVVISFTMADFHTDPNSRRPDCGSFYLATIFKIVDARIRIFDEIREILPLGTTSGWQPAEEHA